MLIEFGINKNLNIKAFKKLGLNTKTFRLQLNNRYKKNIQKFFQKKIFGKKLKQKTKSHIDFVIKNKTYKGMRHKNRYPVRGQRTHTNAKTKKKIKLY